ncbi:glycoside hydrolase family 13 protein [Ruania alba]|uniref:Alpha-glucosidase n=1 Tax=Ruania alba TaxID=648782 RepID=A0A1H5M8L9_9MICO|nr:glycoside hydrolase family 13 protein [Ruania alba]SEE85716.1 alpha-glucosidase [Ruania alba]
MTDAEHRDKAPSTHQGGASLLSGDPNWWRQAVVYQIYPRSFADSNGDGIGDLPGITSRVPYLRDLGVDAVWLSPFYPSALADGGYDVDDYRNVDPRFGTLDDFDEMLAALTEAGIKLIIDIVPNHTSNQHEWFRAALAAPKGSPERDKYLFRDGTGPDGEEPPSDWTSAFGGSAWERVEDGQWYLHRFAVEQPDLNWDNREVREDFLQTLRFWSDRGVAGFRVDVAHMTAKRLPDELPTMEQLRAMPFDGNHPTLDRDEVHEIYAEWREVFNSYDPPRTAVAEAWVPAHRRARYASAEGLGQAFNFDLLQAPFEAEAFRDVIARNLELAAQSGSSTTWVLSNHDLVRHATRYGLPYDPDEFKQGRQWLLSRGTEPVLEADRGLRRARAATMLELALPGSAYLYQGEELGLHEVADIPDHARQDPTFTRKPGRDVGRDGVRVPLPWSLEGPSFGFSDGPPHLPQPSWFAELAASGQAEDAASTLALYREAIALRHRLQSEERLEWLENPPNVLAFARPNGWVCVTNFSAEPVGMPDGEVLLASSTLTTAVPGETTVWLQRCGRHRHETDADWHYS